MTWRLLLVAAALALLVIARPAIAQEPPSGAVFTISVEDRPEAEDSSVRTEATQRLVVTVDGWYCGTWDVAGEAPVRIELGTAIQVPACGRPGGAVILYNAYGLPLNIWYRIEPGTTVVLDNFAPPPPSV